MSGSFSREALTEALGGDLMADIDRRAALRPPAPPEIVDEIQRIFTPTVNRLTHERASVPVLVDAA